MLDKERILKLDLNTMVDFESATGKNMLKLNWQNLSITDTRALLWACLHGEDQTLTLQQVGAMLSLDNVPEITTKLSEVINASVPAKSSTVPLAETATSGTG